MQRQERFEVFVISLERAVERREHMKQLLSDLGFTGTIISAVDGKNLLPEQRARYSSERAKRIYGCDLSDNEIACYLSHLSIYSKMLEQRIDTALILEDDISCVSDLKPIVEDVMKLPRTSWQVMRLQSSKRSVSHPTDKRGAGEPVAQVGQREIFRLRTSVLGGCAYLIRLGAASAMLSRSENIDMPIDQTLDRYWENGIIPYVLRPTSVWHEDLFESEIGARGRALQSGADRKKAVGKRRMQRTLDSFNKRLFWLAFRVPSLGAVMAKAGIHSARMAMIALWGGPAAREI